MTKTLEIAIPTYNRPKILDKWMELNIETIMELGILLSVYDSSTNDETENIINSYNKTEGNIIKYVKLNPTIRVDEKVMISILNTNCDYVWPLGDSRIFDFEIIKKKVLPYLNGDNDIICIYSELKKNNDFKTYTDPATFFDECFWHATWLGGIIYKRELYNFNYGDSTYLKYTKIFNRNDGFSNNGIMFNVLAEKKDVRIITIEIGPTPELSKKKTPNWLKHYVEVWGDNLCYMIDHLNVIYDPYKEKVIREVWNVLKLDGPYWCYKARKAGGLSPAIYHHYDATGLLDRVSSNKHRIYVFATYNKYILHIYYIFYRVYRKIKNGISKVLNKGRHD